MQLLPTHRKTRLAPTPSGYLHLGNAASFLLTYDIAKKTGASLLLRIDDMDNQRVRDEYIADIFDTLRFLEIEWNEGPKDPAEYNKAFRQVYRMDLYEKALRQLRDNGQVFACTCSRTEILKASAEGIYPGTCSRKNIPLDTPGVSWRVHRTEQMLSVRNLDSSIVTAALPEQMQSFVVRKKDGMPAYQLCSLADDLHHGVDLVVRGEDLWPSTLAQLHLASLLGERGFLETTFHHHLLITDAEGKKMSKSVGAESVRALRNSGMKAGEIKDLIRRSRSLANQNFS